MNILKTYANKGVKGRKINISGIKKEEIQNNKHG